MFNDPTKDCIGLQYGLSSEAIEYEIVSDKKHSKDVLRWQKAILNNDNQYHHSQLFVNSHRMKFCTQQNVEADNIN